MKARACVNGIDRNSSTAIYIHRRHSQEQPEEGSGWARARGEEEPIHSIHQGAPDNLQTPTSS